MAYEMVMPYHLHMPSYFLETFTEYPFFGQPPLDYYFLSSVFIIASCIRWEITRYGA